FTLKACPRHCDGGGSKTGGQRSRALAMPIPHSNRTASLRSCRTQRGHQFLLDDPLDGGADPLPHQLLERAFPLPPKTAIAFHGVILRHPPPSGRELWLNSPDLDAFSLFHQLRDTTAPSTEGFLNSLIGELPVALSSATRTSRRLVEGLSPPQA